MRQLKKGIAIDFLYSISASLVVTVALQILVYPSLARFFSNEANGIILTSMGIVNVFSGGFGNSLNNVRLIKGNDYGKSNSQGDFNVLIILASSISTVLMLLIGVFYLKSDPVVILLLLLLTVLTIIRSYYLVAYRITLQYKKNLKCHVFSLAGYLIGLLITYYTRLWPIVFIAGEMSFLIFIFLTSDLQREKFRRTSLFSTTAKTYLTLMLSSFLSNILVYLDRVLIFPVLGASDVTVFTVASFVGKTLGLIISPISSVLLSYYSSRNYVMTISKYLKISSIAVILALCFSVLSIPLAPIITKVLYPNQYAVALPFIFIANLASIIVSTCSVFTSAVIKYAPTKWLILSEMAYGVLYVIISLALMQESGLMGFCVGKLIASVMKIALLSFLGYFYIRRMNAHI